MANMNVTYDEMTTAANQLKEGQSNIEETLHRLRSLVDGLISSGFQTDKASGAFGTSYTDMDEGLKQALTGIGGMADFLVQARDALQGVDEQLGAGLR
ncbi:MAG: hypothetical protein JWQ59_859 [Cryobacterium sp.]|jgi:uncharacterized protein YukE|nr:hypothetical protein [Cryobacterium sp.]